MIANVLESAVTLFGGMDPRWVVELAVKATALLLAAAIVTTCWRSASAAVRHAVWAAAMVAVLALPLLGGLVPARAVIATPSWIDDIGRELVSERLVENAVLSSPQLVSEVAEESPRAAVMEMSQPAHGAEPIVPSGDIPFAFPIISALIAIWLVGGLFVMLPLLFGHIRLTLLSREARAADDGEWGALARSTARQMGIRRHVRILEHRSAAMPMTWGIVRPVILVPAWNIDWSERCRRDVVAHELAHVERHDTLTQLVARAVCALLWFNPLVWYGASRLRIERERACDDRVLATGARASQYARHLLDVAGAMIPTAATSSAALTMARRSQLEGRLLALLDSRRSHQHASARHTAPVMICALAVAAGIAALAPAEARATTVELLAAVEPVVVRAVAPAVQEEPAPFEQVITASSVLPASDPCWTTIPDGLTSIIHETGHKDAEPVNLVKLERGGCRLEIRIDGEFAVLTDMSDLMLPSGSSAVISERTGGEQRRLVITGNSRRWIVEGREQPYDDAARTWLRSALAFANKETGFAADAHARALLESGGLPALVAEMRSSRSGVMIRRYAKAAIETGHNSDDLSRLLVSEMAPRINSDHQRGLLLATALKSGMPDDAIGSYVSAVRSMSSSLEQRTALEPLISQPMNETQYASVLETIATITSDYEKSRLLLAFARLVPLTPPLRDSFDAAASTIKSTYELGRVTAAARAASNR